jgi:hypothetical protein
VKVWFGYGSEHSMNLVMIGRFKDARNAVAAKQMIDRLTAEVDAEVQDGRLEVGQLVDRYSDEMLRLLKDLGLYDIRPVELEQFAYSAYVSVQGTDITLKTDEAEVSAFLKILIEKGARVELFSAHDYPEPGDGHNA